MLLFGEILLIVNVAVLLMLLCGEILQIVSAAILQNSFNCLG